MAEKRTTSEMENLVEELIEKLSELMYTKLYTLECTAYVTKEPLSFENRMEGKKITLKPGDKWANDIFDCAWFHITGIVKEEYIDANLIFLIDCGGEGLVYDKNGEEKQAVTCYASGFSSELGKPHKRVVFTEGLIENNKIDFWIDCAANDLFGNMKDESRVKELSLAVLNEEIRGLYYDADTLYKVYDFGRDDDFNDTILETFADIAEACKDGLDEAKAARLREKAAPLFATKNDGDSFNYTAIGHAHLDLAWLWPLRESYRKAARTFTTQFMNIRRYPGYIFGASQAQLYTWVKDKYPRIYSQLKKYIDEGSWELQGATWVEMDSNLIGGESMLRQFFYGKQFFRKEFSQDMNILWVPDSFGYSACIPQAMALADVPYFLTQKMSWNTVNVFPHHSFYWHGLDGSTVLSHMLPENTYNSPMNATYMVSGEDYYKEREISDKAMLLFGIGDGGAGPGFEHIERLNRLGDIKGLPRVKPGMAKDFFKKFDDGVTKYPDYYGELYLERHQGTYTTQTKNKMFNRKCEFALRNYELLAVQANMRGLELPIAKETLDELWKEVLLYQFHDILPGSSINRVYEESVARYTCIYSSLQNAVRILAEKLAKPRSVVNLNSFAYEKTMLLDGKWKHISLPALGSREIEKAEEINVFSAKAEGCTIENDMAKIIFNEGVIISYFDKTLNREFVAENGAMALLSQYTDVGDCWDIRPEAYEDTKADAVCTLFSCGASGAEAWAYAEYSLGDCKINQRFSLIDGSAMLSCKLKIDVNQENSMLRIAFPTSLRTDECNFNIQFGHISRRTTNENSFETAQFEVSGQKFVDMSEGALGLSLLNDCKYGFKCKNGIIDMDLCRAPKGGPGKFVDQGEQSINYALYPHSGALGIDTYKEAYLLNNPLMLTTAMPLTDAEDKDRVIGTGIDFYSTDNEQIVLESIKIAEDENGILCRLYNAGSSSAKAKVSINGFKMSEICNLLEETREAKTDSIIELRAFELVNIRFICDK